jgi:hypothetical protein
MKNTLALVSLLVTMLFVSGNGMLNAASAQEVSAAAVATPKSSKSRDLVAYMLADSTLQNRSVNALQSSGVEQSIVYLSLVNKPTRDSVVKVGKPIVASLAVAEKPNVVPNKPFKSKVVYWGGRDRYGKYTEECAAHANGRLKKAGIRSFGHAYQIPCWYPSVINGYRRVKVPDLSKISPEKHFLAILNMHRKSSDYVKANLDISKLIPGKYYVVNMYYSTSEHMVEFFQEAKKQGTGNYGTHVGVLYYDQKAQAWIVEHNIHGHVHYNALVSILGGRSNPHKFGVTSISRVSK